MKNKFFYFLLFVVPVAIGMAAIVNVSVLLKKRSNKLNDMRSFFEQMKEDDNRHPQNFFTENVTRSIAEDFENHPAEKQRLEIFSRDSAFYPSNFFWYFILNTHLRPAETYAFPIMNGDTFTLKLLHMPSEPFSTEIVFLQEKGTFKINSVQNLHKYFKYLDCIEQANN